MLKNTKKNDYSLISKKELEKLLNEGLNFTEIKQQLQPNTVPPNVDLHIGPK